MKSFSSVKTRRMYAFGSRTQDKVNPWHSLSVTKKHKKLFGFAKKIYISDWNRVFKKKTFYPAKDAFFKKNHIFKNSEFKNSEMVHLLASNFWAFRHPMEVPGVVQIKRSKTYYKNYQKNLSNILLWFGGMTRSTFLSLCKETIYWNKLYQNISFALFFDSLLPNLMLKTGFTKNVYSAKKSLIQQQSLVDYDHRLHSWSAANSAKIIFVKNHFFLKNLRNFQKNINKYFHYSCIIKIILKILLYIIR